MAKNENVRIASKSLNSDIVAHDALKKMTGYKGVEDISLESIQKVRDLMAREQEKENQLARALKTQRDLAVAAEWEFHNTMMAAKSMVKAQFRMNSNQVQEVGLKKISDYKRPKRNKKGGDSSKPA
jgi:hypothetical protein